MAKIYIKTITLTSFFVILLFMRLGLFAFSVPVPVQLSNFLLFIVLVAIIINEKLTRAERWKRWHFMLLFLVAIFYFVAVATFLSKVS